MFFYRSNPRSRNTLVLFALMFTFSISVPFLGAAELNFRLAPRHLIGQNTIQTRYGDLDGDGHLDAFAVNGGQENPNPQITIRYGKANGDFDPPVVFSSSGLIGHTLTASDVNNDGQPDLIVGSWYQNAIGIYLNQGNRQFAAPIITIPPDPPNPGFPYGEFFDIAVGDFDGDGSKDVVALQDQVDQRLRFFHFNPDLTLTVFRTIPQNETGTSYERVIEVADINGDDRPDIVFAGGGPFGVRSISYVFGQAPGGTLSISYGNYVDDQTVGISLEDLDNDGDRDMIVAFLDTTTPTRHSLQVFLNSGNGTFIPNPKIFLEYPFPPNDVTVADLDNDGILDMAALISSVMIRVSKGNGDGTFTGETYYSVSGSNSIYSADLNGDNAIDLLTAASTVSPSNTISTMFNENLRGFAAPLATLWGPSFIAAGDFNSDGYNDMASAWATSFTSTSGVDLMINDRAQSFLPEIHHPSPTALNEMKTGDFNGDGKWDAVSAHDDNSRVVAVYLGNGMGTLSQPVNTQFTRGLKEIIVGDFDSDGRDDIFTIDDNARGFSMLSNSDGTLTTAPGSPVSLPEHVPFELQKGDFDRDGNIDLVITMNSTSKLWLGDGAGRFTQSAVSIPDFEHPVPGDFNGDGNLDLAGTSSDGIKGVLGDGNGGFGQIFTRQIDGVYVIHLTRSIVSADFDLDGYDDIALLMEANTSGNLIVIQSGGSAGLWKLPVYYGVGTASRTLIAEDFNADGSPDLGFLGGNSRGVIYNNLRAPRTYFDFDGDSRTDVSIFRPGPSEWWYLRSSDGTNRAFQFGQGTDQLAPADYTGDGKADVGFWRQSTGEWFILRSEDSSFYSFPFGTTGDIPVPADYDGDGKADPAVFRPTSATWFIMRSSDGGTTIQSFGANGDRPVPADYDGDNKADIAIFRPSDGSWWLNRSQAGVVVTNFGVSTDKNVPGDYTGDGKADVAFYRPSSGEWFILRSEDFSFYSFPFGAAGDVPAPGDYDGDGKTDPTVFRPSNSTWFKLQSTSGFEAITFGLTNDIPVPSAFVR